VFNVLLVLGVFASAPQCPPAPTAARTIEIVGTDNMKYSVARIDAKPGETLRLVLIVQSKLKKDVMAHNIVVLAKGANAAKFNAAAMAAKATEYIPVDRKPEILASTALAGGGETVEVTFTLPDKAGTYDFICTFPGHFALGMKGVIAVK
jgi:azurin